MTPEQYKTLNEKAMDYVDTLSIDKVRAEFTLTPLLNTNSKLQKNELPSLGLELTPSTFGGFKNNCGNEGECLLNCIAFTSIADKFKGSSMELSNALKKKLRRAFLFQSDKAFFIDKLEREIQASILTFGKIALRLNVVSDINWGRFFDFSKAPYKGKVEAYSYTKHPQRLKSPKGQTFTYSASEKDSSLGLKMALEKGQNIAMAFDCSKKALQKAIDKGATFQGFPLLNGDLTDERYLDPKGVIVALSRKVPQGGKGGDRAFFFPLDILELSTQKAS